MSLFITFEGVEGCGKTTQIKILKDILLLRGYGVVLTREPGGSAIGDQIRKVLLLSSNQGMTDLCELFLYAASRNQHVEKVIRPALAAQKIILCDRFMDATLAYQGYGRGIPLETICQINGLATRNLRPHLTILLDCNPEVGLRRAIARISQSQEEVAQARFEKERMEFHQKVRKGYLALARQETERFTVVNAEQDKDVVHQQIVDVVLKKLTEQVRSA